MLTPMSGTPEEDLYPRFPQLDTAAILADSSVWRELVAFHLAAMLANGITDPGSTLGTAMWLESVHQKASQDDRWSLTLASARAAVLSVRYATARGFRANMNQDIVRAQRLEPGNLVHEGMLDGILVLRGSCQSDAVSDLWSWTAGPDCNTIHWVSLHLTLLTYAAKVLFEIAAPEGTDPLAVLARVLGDEEHD